MGSAIPTSLAMYNSLLFTHKILILPFFTVDNWRKQSIWKEIHKKKQGHMNDSLINDVQTYGQTDEYIKCQNNPHL